MIKTLFYLFINISVCSIQCIYYLSSILIQTFIHLSIHLSIYLTVLHPSVWPSDCPSIYLSIHPSIHPSIHLFIHPSIYLSIQPPISTSIIYPSIHWYINISIHLSTLAIPLSVLVEMHHWLSWLHIFVYFPLLWNTPLHSVHHHPI